MCDGSHLDRHVCPHCTPTRSYVHMLAVQVDDDPAPRAQVLEYAAHLLGMAEPSSSGAADEPPAGVASGGGGRGGRGGELEEKRVSNARMKQQRGIQLAFPSYREGLVAIAMGNTAPFAPADLSSLGYALGGRSGGNLASGHAT